MNRLGVMRPSAYVLAGLPLWVALLKGGVHPTIAGVIVGLSVPARPRYSRTQAKLGILAASTLAAILGLAVLSRGGRPATGGTPG